MRQHVTLSNWRRAVLPGARLLVLLAALAGLFAMHGMSDHGTMHHGSSETHKSATMMAHAGPSADVHQAVASVAHGGAIMMNSAMAAVETAATGDVLDGGLHVAMGLCLAILAGAVALALRRLRTWAHPLTPALLETMQQLLPARARDPDPPDLHALSIQRC